MSPEKLGYFVAVVGGLLFLMGMGEVTDDYDRNEMLMRMGFVSFLFGAGLAGLGLWRKGKS